MNPQNETTIVVQNEFDLAIGQLVLSKLVCWGKSGTMDQYNQQTLKHHAEDMVAAGECILKALGKGVEGTPQPSFDPDLVRYENQMPPTAGQWPINPPTKEEVERLAAYIEGKQINYVPDTSESHPVLIQLQPKGLLNTLKAILAENPKTPVFVQAMKPQPKETANADRNDSQPT